jgi:hypothetical protein
MKRTTGKMVNVSIKDFTGSKDGSEDYEEFLDDIEFALDQMEEDQRTDKNRLRFFRQHLKGEAAKWWNLDIPHAEKKDWKETVKAFTNKYGEGVQVEKKKWQMQNEIAALFQQEGESIASYVHRAKVIDRKSTPEMSNQLAMSFLRGMRDIPQKRMVEFTLGSDKYTARSSIVIEKVMSSYHMIGEADPFEDDSSGMPSGLSLTPAYIAPPGTISSAAAAQVHAEPANNNKSDEVMARILAILEEMDAEEKADFEKPAHCHPSGVNPAKQGQSRRGPTFEIGRIQGWTCGNFGHFADSCTNEPLLTDKQTALRKSILAERRRAKKTQSEEEVSSRTPIPILTNGQGQKTLPTPNNTIQYQRTMKGLADDTSTLNLQMLEEACRR